MAKQFARPTAVHFAPEDTNPISANEVEPVAGVLTEWWCSSDGIPDEFDQMWMAIIGATVRSGATPAVLMPVYAQDTTYEEEAKQIWTDLGFDVVPVKADAITPLAGQLHCITKTLDEASE